MLTALSISASFLAIPEKGVYVTIVVKYKSTIIYLSLSYTFFFY